jgi:hypothetical protein
LIRFAAKRSFVEERQWRKAEAHEAGGTSSFARRSIGAFAETYLTL